MNWYKRIIAEILRIDNQWVTKAKAVPIELDPSLEKMVQLANQSKWNQVRMLPTSDGWYVWPADMAIHAAVREALGLSGNIVRWEADGPIAKVEDDKLLIWLPPESESEKASLPWTDQIRPNDHPEWNYHIPLKAEGAIQPQRSDVFEEQLNVLDKPTSPYYSRWGD